MANYPSYNGIGSRAKTALRTDRKEPETQVTTQRDTPSTPPSRGYA